MEYNLTLNYGHTLFQGTYIENARIFTEDGGKYKIVKVLEKDMDKDYIIFQVEQPYNKSFPKVKIASNDPEIGETVFTIGNPEGFEKTLSNGIVSSFRGDEKDYIQTTTPITHGSSGGPLFNMKGEVIGITSMGKQDGSLFFAINIKMLKLYHYTK